MGSVRSYPALFLFAGLGGGALGFQQARARVEQLAGRFHIAGAVDFDPKAAADFEMLTGHPCTVADISTMTPDQLRAICPEPPTIVFGSPPCQGNSSCLPADKAKTKKYKDMNALAVRSLFLVMEAWPDNPPALILTENVPRITVRSRHLLDQITMMLNHYGYVTNETVHDCGELGGLGQRRKRFLMVARHTKLVSDFWREPVRQPLKSIGDVIGSLPVPLPGSSEGGPMHRLPRMSAMNWLRLALIPAGGDWRDLPEKVAVAKRAGRQNGGYGVNDWDQPGHTVLAEGSVHHTWASVSDPRSECTRREGSMGVTGWDQTSTTVIAKGGMHNGPWQVGDPRLTERPGRHLNKWRVTGYDDQAGTVICTMDVQSGAPVVADPSLSCSPRAGAYGVLGWDGPSGCIVAAACHDNGAHAIADPRVPELRWAKAPEVFDLDSRKPLKPEGTPIIIAADGTWHRPLTTLELAALQGLPTKINGEWAVYGGGTHGAARKAIGNAVPPPTAKAIAETALRTLLLSELGTWELSASPIWVERERRASL